MSPAAVTLHGSCVVLQGQGVLILGPSGAGKSALALQMMGLGADLVADDQVALRRQGAQVRASAPPGLPALIEARGVGLLHARLIPEAPLALIVDLGQVEPDRLPPWRHRDLLGLAHPLVLGPLSGHLAASLRQFLLQGRGA